MDARKIWYCADCGSEYGTPEDAVTCCPPEKRVRWQCAKCRYIWLGQKDAEECCKEQEQS